MVVCFKHQTVSAWGCPDCRKEAFDRITKEAIEETERRIKEAFR